MGKELHLDERILAKACNLLEHNLERYSEQARQLMTSKSYIETTESYSFGIELKPRELKYFAKTFGFYPQYSGTSSVDKSEDDTKHLIEFQFAKCEAIVMLTTEEFAKQ
jgi:hypothetical protein